MAAQSPPNSPPYRNWLFYASGVAFVLAGYFFGLMEVDVLVTPSFFCALVCVALANLDRVQSFKAAGVEAVMREAKAAVRESRDLALITSKMLLSLVQRTGRLGQFTTAEQEEVQSGVDRVLDQFEASDAERRQVYSDWNRFVTYDYMFGILGGHTVPKFAKDEAQATERWKAIRSRGIHSPPPAPDELREFLRDTGLLDAEREELIEDYAYFLKHHRHRRPEAWERRKEWTTRRLGEPA